MTGARRRALSLVLIALGAAGLTITLVRRDPSPLPRAAIAARPALMLLTSLPLLFGEDFSLAGSGSPALTSLQARYKVLPISVTGAADLAQGRLLLMAQPPAQTAENLVMLDRWVRDGGRVMLLADPMLEWPSNRPLGDPLRPSPMFADTGLLAHWNLRLDAPDQRGSSSEGSAAFTWRRYRRGRCLGVVQSAATPSSHIAPSGEARSQSSPTRTCST